MKKLIALTLCLLFLLSGCGYLGGASGARVELRDLYITGEKQALDMRGLSAGVEIGSNGDVYGLRLTVSANDQLKNEMIVAVVEDSVLFLLNGGTGEPGAYVIDDPQVVGPIQEAFDAVMAADVSLPEGGDADLESMTDEELDEYMAQLEQQLQSMIPDSEQDPEAAEQAAAQLERMAEILEQCVTEGEPREFEGETYQTKNFDLPHDELMELLGLIDTEPYTDQDVDLPALLNEAGVTLDVTGVIAVNGDGSKSAYGISPVFTTKDGETVALNITLQQTADDGSIGLYFDISDNGQAIGSLSVDLDAALLDEADWLPEAVSAGAQPVDPDDQASTDAFVDALADFVGQVSGTAAGVMLGNGAVGMLN